MTVFHVCHELLNFIIPPALPNPPIVAHHHKAAMLDVNKAKERDHSSSRKYYPWRNPRPPLAALLLLCFTLRIYSASYTYSNLPLDSDSPLNSLLTPVTHDMKEYVLRHSTLALCTNSKQPGTFRGMTSRAVMSLNTRTPITLLIVLSMCGDIETNPGPASYKDVFLCGWCEIKVD